MATGKFATNGASFAGAATSYLTVPGIPNLGGGFWTVGVWIYPTTAGSNGQTQTLLVNDYKGQSGTHLHLYNNAGSLQAKLSVVDAETDATQTATAGSNVTLNAWNLIMAGASPWPTTVGQASIWVSVNNGTKGTATLPYRARGANSNLDIGARPQGGGSPYTGRMSNLTIANKAWSAQELTNFYNGGAGMDYPFVDPTVTYTFYQYPASLGTNLWSWSYTGTYTDVDELYNAAEDCQLQAGGGGAGCVHYNGQPGANASGGVYWNLTAPDSGIVINYIKVHIRGILEGGGGCAVVLTGTQYHSPSIRVGGTTYTAPSNAVADYWNYNALDCGCTGACPFNTMSYQWTNNPATGLAWTVSDLQNLQVGAYASINVAGGKVGDYSHGSVYVEVNATVIQ